MVLSPDTIGPLPPRKRHGLFGLALAGLAITLAAAAPASAAQLIQNGDFEAGGGSLTGWSSTGSVDVLVAADYVPCCATTGTEPGFSSDHFAAFGADNTVGPHTLSQTFATVIGETYHLFFSAGALGLPGGQVLLVAPLGSYGGGGIFNTVTSNFDRAFFGSDIDFQATEPLTTLEFTVNTPGVDGHDAILDDVSVTGPSITDGGGAAVPEPASWALMLTGFATLGAALRGHRRSRRQLVRA
jgi:hypothetical protein